MIENKEEEITEEPALNDQTFVDGSQDNDKLSKIPNTLILLLLCIFVGYLGLDKLYFDRASKESVFWFACKLICSIIIIGVIWNILDIIFCLLGKYKLNPIYYFSEQQAKNIDYKVDSFVNKK